MVLSRCHRLRQPAVHSHVLAAQRAVPVRLIMDQTQTHSGSSNAQAFKMLQVIRGGVEVRFLPSRQGRNMLHQKCLVVDSSVYLVGSANMTAHSRYNCFEFAFCGVDHGGVRDCARRLEDLWGRGVPFGLEQAEKAYDAKQRRLEARRTRSTSSSMTREVEPPA